MKGNKKISVPKNGIVVQTHCSHANVPFVKIKTITKILPISEIVRATKNIIIRSFEPSAGVCYLIYLTIEIGTPVIRDI